MREAYHGVVRAVVLLLLAAGCAPAVPRARRGPAEPPSAREVAQRDRMPALRHCWNLGWLLIPGGHQLCTGEQAEGAILLSFAAAEAEAGIAVGQRAGFEHPGAALPLITLQDLLLISFSDALIDRNLARHDPYAPPDTLWELVRAPWNPRVLRRPSVWAGIVGLVAAGVGASLLVDESLGDGWGDDANLFGRDFPPATGYPLAGAVGVGTFTHVAIAEEMFFRGVFQSMLARQHGETGGWIRSSIWFGAAHAPNALLLPEDQRAAYLFVGVPYITVIGSYLGLVYRWNDYSLAPPVAVHFWYDFLISAAFFLMDPQDSPLSARVGVSF